MQRRICLITPGHLATNPRIVKEADALTERGYDVTIIAGDFSMWARVADREFIDRPWRLAQRLSFGPMASLNQRAMQLFRQRAAAFLFRIGITKPHVRRAAWHPIGPDLVRAAGKVSADLYIAHYVAALPAAALAAKRHGALYAFDAEDFHLGDLPDIREHAAKKVLIRAIEGCHLPGCAYVTAASPGIARAYTDSYRIPEPTVVLNVFPLNHAPDSATAAGVVRPSPSLYWFSQTIGPDRGLQCAVHALALAATKPHLYIRGTPIAGFHKELCDLACRFGVREQLHFLPPVMPSQMERLAAEFDAGFSGEIRDTRNRELALANKLFSYLLAGLPIIMSDVAAHRSLAFELGTAARLYSTDDPHSLAAAMDNLLSDQSTLAQARAAAFVLGRQRFNWNVEKERLLELVDSVLCRQKVA